MTKRIYEAYTPRPVNFTGWRKGMLAIKEKCAADWADKHHKQFCEGCPNLERCRQAFDIWI